MGESNSKVKDDLVSSVWQLQTKSSSRMVLKEWVGEFYANDFRRYRQQFDIYQWHHVLSHLTQIVIFSAMYVTYEEKSKLIWQLSDPVVLIWESLEPICEKSINLSLSSSKKQECRVCHQSVSSVKQVYLVLFDFDDERTVLIKRSYFRDTVIEMQTACSSTPNTFRG